MSCMVCAGLDLILETPGFLCVLKSFSRGGYFVSDIKYQSVVCYMRIAMRKR